MERLIVLCLLAVLMVGCQRSAQRITVYGYDGHPIKSWVTHGAVFTDDGECWFNDDTGRRTVVAGTFTVEPVDEQN